jgi:putative heme iron utilization protein
MSEIGNEARRLMRAQHNGVLCTHSLRLEGYPFGSVAPFITDHAGQPVILISTIAEHTKNIKADPRVSLIVQPFSMDMQETARITVVGRAVPIDDKDRLGPRYLRRFPQAEAYFAMHDFQFHVIEPVRIRYIGGFGKVHWLEPASFLRDPGQLADVETGILTHMNRDHADSLHAYARYLLGVNGQDIVMTGIDPDGFDLRIDGLDHRIDFEHPVLDAEAARNALVGLAKAHA